jgi:hypothetical protein
MKAAVSWLPIPALRDAGSTYRLRSTQYVTGNLVGAEGCRFPAANPTTMAKRTAAK